MSIGTVAVIGMKGSGPTREMVQTRVQLPHRDITMGLEAASVS